MAKINVLPKYIADLSAAGEVVERPSSVVKEAVENSIDAGATIITVEIQHGGITYIRITDNGCGMTEEELDKNLGTIAKSGSFNFKQENEKTENVDIIGQFGVGFYSAFMVAEKVTIETLSWKDGAKAVKWSCDGSPEYAMEECDKTDRGTVITLYIAEDEKEFAQKSRISGLLNKYCKFMPVPVIFGKEQEWKDGKYEDTDKDNVINKIEPLWAKKPADLKDEDYNEFYKALYPMADEPLFHIHLNVDYPFNLTGILYFPKIKNNVEISRNKIQLYCNQMFVTDSVENIVPEFLTLLHGVIDSPDIPLNVSRSYLQSDANVKKISTYITKKVADRLDEIFRNERQQLEEKWDNLKLFIEYGMLSDEKFCDRAMKFCLLKNTEGKYFSIEDYRKAIESSQTDKDKKVVFLYATDAEAQYSFIDAAKNRGYDVLLMDCHLDSHFVNLLEAKLENVRFARVDSDSIDNLIPTEDKIRPELSEADQEALSTIFKAVLPTGNEYHVQADNLGADAAPILITQSEFMRRYREMSAMGGGMNFYGEMPAMYNITVNMENPLVARIMAAKTADVAPAQVIPDAASDASEDVKRTVTEAKEAAAASHKSDLEAFAGDNEILKQITDLALLANGMLKGKDLSDFIARSAKVVEDAYL